jgi:L-glutamine:scyllo-inosose aminotransferase/L-glutamine:2-deoxy-scyllo-inosose/3-amino-2,3-dideoxy-scyllo-inosose aminotransferase
MAKLAINGGKPITKNLLGKSQLEFRPDLERKYLLEVFDKGPGDDWPGVKSIAATFAAQFAAFHTARYCALLTNGTHALQVALETLDIGAGDEVIVPGLTWQATASAVCDVNAVPVLVDVDPETICLDPAKAEAAITPSRWKLPVADSLWKDRAILCHWSMYGLAPSRAPLLTDAIAKLHENRAELLNAARK